MRSICLFYVTMPRDTYEAIRTKNPDNGVIIQQA